MKEIADATEREVKFDVAAWPTDEDALAWLSDACPIPVTVQRWVPRAAVDIYLDASGGGLRASGSSCRLRRLNAPTTEGRGFSVNFKSPSTDGGELLRREVRTRVLDRDLTDYPAADIPGAAAALAYGVVRAGGREDAQLLPVALLTTHRRDAVLIERATGRMLVSVLIDHTEGWPLLDAERSDLVTTPGAPLPAGAPVIFDEGEVELVTSAERSPKAQDVYEHLLLALEHEGVQRVQPKLARVLCCDEGSA